jgi:hypothetical protein
VITDTTGKPDSALESFLSRLVEDVRGTAPAKARKKPARR